MDDRQIVELYWERSENAIAESQKKYAGYCRAIAYAILDSREDAEECVNTSLLRAWEAIPPARPAQLSTYLGRITRNLALNRRRQAGTQRRGGGQVPLALNELEDCLPDRRGTEAMAEQRVLAEALNGFLAGLPLKKRRLFVRRYWYLQPLAKLAEAEGIPESRLKSQLFRLRKQLKAYLEEEGISV
ncbi:MAG TPA: sigma-70 family RNA polymerase sigma factor [Firmicutes bacterium]|nr:sigma-70 family RNA polymerase sigma factor [Bacillota bacterium]